ncbi:unnamed protein product, partial [Ilex paraguariensis]
MKGHNNYLHQQQMIQFHMGLHETYASLRIQILLMDSLPPISKANVLVLQDETQRDQIAMVIPSNDSSAFAARISATS